MAITPNNFDIFTDLERPLGRQRNLCMYACICLWMHTSGIQHLQSIFKELITLPYSCSDSASPKAEVAANDLG